MKTRVPKTVFGDAVMVLEFVNAFKNVFDFKQFFPKGFSWGEPSFFVCLFVFLSSLQTLPFLVLQGLYRVVKIWKMFGK